MKLKYTIEIVKGALWFICALTVIRFIDGQKNDLDSNHKKMSYALGQKIGQNLRNQGVDIDVEAFTTAFKDISQGRVSLLNSTEAQENLTKLDQVMGKKQEERAEKNRIGSLDFLKSNKSQVNVKTTSSGLQYVMLEEGSGKMPGPQDIVDIHYQGALTNGEIFDKSHSREFSSAVLPLISTIRGLSEAIQLMKTGGKMRFFIPPDLGYGSDPRPGIPPNSILVFEVELLKVSSSNDNQFNASVTQKKTKISSSRNNL